MNNFLIDTYGNKCWYDLKSDVCVTDNNIDYVVYKGKEKFCIRLHREDGPAFVSPKEERFYIQGKMHREDGPAYDDGIDIKWCLNNHEFSFDIWLKKLNKTEEEINFLKLKYDNRKKDEDISSNVFECLIGKTIEAIFTDNESDNRLCGGFVVKTTNKELYAFEQTQNCCERRSLAHISGIEYLIGGTIIEVTARGYEKYDDGDYEYIENVFYQIKTNKGYFDFEARNDHNGFYGGITFERIDNFSDLTGLEEITEDY